MKSNLFLLISCECILLFCYVVAYTLDADKRQVLVKARLAFSKEVSGAKRNDSDNTYKNNHAVSLPSKLKYNSGTTVTAFSSGKMSNSPPSVKISTPENNSFFDWNTLVNYTIKVSDVEDGESDSLEIVSNEVILEVVYLPDASMAIDYAGKKTNSNIDSPGFSLLRISDCFSCHDVKARLQGPSFLEIARRYPHTPATVKMLAGRVIEGSSGVWGIPAMTSHPDLSEEEAGQIVQWIFENAEDPNRSYYSGTKGTFKTKAKSESGNNGVYVLTASYTDHGPKGMSQPGKTGLHTIMLRSK